MIPAFNAAGEFPQACSCFKENPDIYAAPYSSSATDTVSGLSNPEFMNTFGMFIPRIYRCSQIILQNSHAYSSFLVPDHGYPHADLHGLRNTNQHRLYTYLSIADCSVFAFDGWLLAVS